MDVENECYYTFMCKNIKSILVFTVLSPLKCLSGHASARKQTPLLKLSQTAAPDLSIPGNGRGIEPI